MEGLTGLGNVSGRMWRHRWIKTPQNPEPLCCYHCADLGVSTSVGQLLLQWVAQWLLSHLLVVWLCQVSPAVQRKKKGYVSNPTATGCDCLTLRRGFGNIPVTWTLSSFFKKSQSELKPAARKVCWCNALHYTSLHFGKTYSPDWLSLLIRAPVKNLAVFIINALLGSMYLFRQELVLTWALDRRVAERHLVVWVVDRFFCPCEQRAYFPEIHPRVSDPIAEAKAGAIDHTVQRHDCLSDPCWGWLCVSAVSVFALVAVTDQASRFSAPFMFMPRTYLWNLVP